MRAAINQHAYHLMLEFGPHHVTIDDIVKSMGISKKTFYEHYSSKNELVAEVFEEWTGRMKMKIENINEQGWNVLTKYLEIQKHFLLSLGELNVSFVRELRKYYPDLFNSYKLFEQEVVRSACVRHLEEARVVKWINEDTAIPSFCDYNIYTLSKLIFAFHNNSLADLYKQFIVGNLRGIITTSFMDQYQLICELSVLGIISYESR